MGGAGALGMLVSVHAAAPRWLATAMTVAILSGFSDAQRHTIPFDFIAPLKPKSVLTSLTHTSRESSSSVIAAHMAAHIEPPDVPDITRIYTYYIHNEER